MHARIGVFSPVIVTLLVLFSMPIFSSAASQSACPQLPLLSYGATDASTHGAVSGLQRFLAATIASSSSATSTGFFGPMTRTRLRAFQLQSGLKVSGVVDSSTAAAIASFCNAQASSTEAVVAPAASVSFDEGQSFTSLRADPILTGTAQGVSGPLRLVVHPDGVSGVEAAVYENDAVPVSSDGRWSAHVFPSLPNGPYVVDAYASSTMLATLPMQVGLVSFPTIIPDFSLPQSDVADGRLLRFGISAGASGPVSIEQLSFAVATTALDVSQASLYEYSDPAYSMPVTSSADASASSSASSSAGSAASSTGLLNVDAVDPSSGQFAIVPDAPITIPAGETQYFELDASVVPSDTPYSITTTLLGDPSPDTPTLQTLAQLPASTNFIWSPDTFDTASTTEADWATGDFVYGLAADITETRGSPPVELPPTCTITTDQSAITPPSSVTVTWTSTDAQSAVWGDGTSALTQGSKTFLVTSAPHNFMLTVTGTYGVGECVATVGAIAAANITPALPAPSSPATSSVATSTPADSFSASPATGPAPLAVTFKGTVNNSLSCAATTYTFAYGDNSTTTVAVAAKLCKPVSFTLSHTYKTNAVYSAKLYRGAFPGTASARPVLIQTVVITATTTKTKVSATAASPLTNLAAAYAAVNSQTMLALERFLHSLFGR